MKTGKDMVRNERRGLIKPTIANLRRAVERLGGKLVDNGCYRRRDWSIEAPSGWLWACDVGVHMLVVNYDPLAKGESAAATIDAFERIAYGLEECREQECDYCNDF